MKQECNKVFYYGSATGKPPRHRRQQPTETMKPGAWSNGDQRAGQPVHKQSSSTEMKEKIPRDPHSLSARLEKTGKEDLANGLSVSFVPRAILLSFSFFTLRAGLMRNGEPKLATTGGQSWHESSQSSHP